MHAYFIGFHECGHIQDAHDDERSAGDVRAGAYLAWLSGLSKGKLEPIATGLAVCPSSSFPLDLSPSLSYPTCMALEVLKIDIDRQSGHITAHVRAVEANGPFSKLTYGPTVVEGISYDGLTHAYGCPAKATPDQVQTAITAWLQKRHTAALAQKQSLDSRASVVRGFHGKTLTFESATATATAPAPAPGAPASARPAVIS